MRLARVKGIQHALANAIAGACFLDHLQISDDEVLAGIASRFGCAREEALQVVSGADELGTTHDLAVDAAQQGIQGVPFLLSGCYPQDVFDRVVQQVLTAAEDPPLSA